ncbi:MAG: transporter substrate-binding domain-containing protein [Anaerolineae bacterium]|nr:transporter substrate-binding domain-containing protein [Anaerolineae bacterium]
MNGKQDLYRVLIMWGALVVALSVVSFALAAPALPVDTPGVVQQGTPDAPATLVPPTPLPVFDNPVPTPVPTTSAVARIRGDGVLRIGVLYNNAPLSSLSERGEVVGYEADIARAVAEDWGVEAAFVQVTRQTAVPLLLAGEVDVLMASVVHGRQDEALLGFSYTYFPGGQMFMVRADDEATEPAQLSGQTIGVVQGTSSEIALGHALSAGQFSATPVLYLTLDQAVGALGSGEVRAVLADRVSLLRHQADTVRILETMLEPEPYAIAYRRHDDAVGYLLNRSLQRLESDDRLEAIRREWFPTLAFVLAIPIWSGLEDDTRDLNAFDAGIIMPPDPLVPRLAAGGTLRVAGLDLSETASDFTQRMDGFYQALVQEMAGRWGVTAEFVPNSAATALDLVAGGQADLAVGIQPRWDGPYEVAYSSPLIWHGQRLMVPLTSEIEGFADLRGGRWVGIFGSEPGTADQVNELAESVNAVVNIYTIVRDQDAWYAMVQEANIDAAFGDSLRLLPQVEEHADLVRLTDTWYSEAYLAMGLPRHDPDFRALVEITLQEMDADGAFARVWEATLGFDEPPTFERWPGERREFMGVRTGG